MSAKPYDLTERTAQFGEEVIDFCRNIRESTINRTLINQLIRSATSVGANYMEANGASSKKDFRNKIYICKKEIQETKHWLRMFNKTNPEKSDFIKLLEQEAKELSMIFGKIAASTEKLKF